MAERQIILKLSIEEERALSQLLGWACSNIRSVYTDANPTGMIWSDARIDAIGRVNAALNADRT